MNIPALFQSNPMALALVVFGVLWLLSIYGPQLLASMQTAATNAAAAIPGPAVAIPAEAALASVMDAYRICHAAGMDEVCAHLLAAQSKIPGPAKEAPHA